MKVAGCRNEMRNFMTMAMEFMPKEIAFNEHIKMVIKLARVGERNEAFGMVQRVLIQKNKLTSLFETLPQRRKKQNFSATRTFKNSPGSLGQKISTTLMG